MIRFNETYPVPQRCMPWVRRAILELDVIRPGEWDGTASCRYSPWRVDGKVNFRVKFNDNVITICSEEGKDDAACAQHFMRYLLRQIGETFLVWTMTWRHSMVSVCAMNLFKEEWSHERDEETAAKKLAQYKAAILESCHK